MKRKIITLFIAIVLIALVIAANPVSAALPCILNANEISCEDQASCFWCPTLLTCLNVDTCPTCGQLAVADCKLPTCHWCANSVMCYPSQRPCTCGNNIADPGEECESTFSRYCDPDTCKCTGGMIPDQNNPGFCKAAQVCGDGVLEGTEQCEFGKYCVNCQCQSPAVQDPHNLGSCFVPPGCGNGVLEGTEQCDSTSHCKTDCTCESGFIPDSGFCIAAQVCGDGVVNGNEECDDTTPSCVDCKCTSLSIPENGICVTLPVCGDGIVDPGEECDNTQNCDPESCTCTGGSIPKSGFCIVTCVPTTEICDGLDNDCNGTVDEELGSTTCGTGTCARAVDNCVNGQAQACVPGAPSAEICDGLDNDCDSAADEELGSTTCGVGVCGHTIDNCVNGENQSCDPFEGASDEVCDSLDNDCDGQVDEGLTFDLDGDGYSSPNSCSGTRNDCNDNNAAINPGTFEIPGNSVDENCDAVKLCYPDTQWKNHGAFVSCVSKEAEKLLAQGLIAQAQKDKMVSGAAKTNIGK